MNAVTRRDDYEGHPHNSLIPPKLPK